MDMQELYPVTDWKDALEAAEEAYWCDVQAREDAGELASYLAQEYTHDKIGRDKDRLRAVISALEEHGEEEFSADRFEKVMLSMREGDTEADYAKLVEEWLKEHGADSNVVALVEALVRETEAIEKPNPTNWQKIYDRSVLAESDTYAENPEGGTLYYFNKWAW